MFTILIAEDSTFMRLTLRYMLEASGFFVYEAEDGKQAIDLYNSFKPDLVMLDVNMPIFSGIDATNQIRQQDPAAKIIMITSENRRSKVCEAMKNGASYYLLKPLEEVKVGVFIKNYRSPYFQRSLIT